MIISQLQPWASLLFCYSLLEELVLHCMTSPSHSEEPEPTDAAQAAPIRSIHHRTVEVGFCHVNPHWNSPSYLLPSSPSNLHPNLPPEQGVANPRAGRRRVTFGSHCGWSPRDTRPCIRRCGSRTSRTRWRPWRGLWSRTLWWHSASPRTCMCWGGRWAGTRPRSSSCGRPRTPCCCRAPCSSPGTRGGNTRFGLCRLASRTSWGTLQDTKQGRVSKACWGTKGETLLCATLWRFIPCALERLWKKKSQTRYCKKILVFSALVAWKYLFLRSNLWHEPSK